MSNTKPFPVDTATTPIVTAAHEQLRRKYRSAVAEAKANYESALEQRWADAEKKRKSDWIAKERYDNPPRRLPNPYADLNDAAIVRVATVPEDRIKILGETYVATKDTDFLVEATRVFLYRSKSKAKLSTVLEFLSAWITVAGDEEIYTESHSTYFDIPGAVGRGRIVPNIAHHVIADGLSPDAVRVLRGFKIKSGMVYFVTAVDFEDRPGQPAERWTYAHLDEQYDSSEY